MLQPTTRLPSGLIQLAPDPQASPILPHSQIHFHTSNLNQYAHSNSQTRPLYPSDFILSEPFPTTRPTPSTSPLSCPDYSVHIRHRTNKKIQLKIQTILKFKLYLPPKPTTTVEMFANKKCLHKLQEMKVKSTIINFITQVI